MIWIGINRELDDRMMELLCPAGDRDALIAAVANGADAVYLGGQALNARRGAGNFDADGLKWAADHCHERGARLFVTVNTIVKQAELPLLHDIAGQLARAGADAAIVQDIGAAAALRAMLPGLEIHASTQMAVHNRRGVQFCIEQGFSRVVLAREMSDREIADCAGLGPELEVFGHGALCVACSGQCLFSSLVGGRSGNRGMCAQPCRLPYRLGQDGGYLLSPKDLMQLGRLAELEALGVRSIKIEGRLKRPEYVAVVTRIYRDMLDHPHEVTEGELAALRQIFNRGGFTRGYGPGLIDSELMAHDRPNHCGVRVGEFVSPGRVRLTADVSVKDQLTARDEPVRLSGAAGEIVRVDVDAAAGVALIRLADDEQLKAARQTYEGPEMPRVKLRGRLMLRVGKPMRLWIADGEREVAVEGDIVARAEKRGADEIRIRAQIEKTGGTIYAFEALELDVDADAFTPASALNELRRSALDALRAQRIEATRGCGRVVGSLPQAVLPDAGSYTPVLRVQSSDINLLEHAREWGADEMIYAPDDITAMLAPPAGCMLALPMVCSDESLDVLRDWAWEHEIRGVIASNPAHFMLDWPGEMQADYSLNVANELTIQAINGLGAEQTMPSVELTAREIAQLGGRRELAVYGRLPLMQLRHCPLNAQREGARHDTCRACDRDHAIESARLVDRRGVAFPLQRLKTPDGCIVRVLNSVPLSMIRHITKLPRAAAWRIMLTDEAPDLARAIIETYAIAKRGGDPRQSPRWPLIEAMDTTTGHYLRGVE